MAEQTEAAPAAAPEIAHDELGFERIVFFSDAVMAIAITLMALEIRVPELEPELAAAQINDALLGLLPHIYVYILSFLVIGAYWLVHHRVFRQVKRFDSSLIWLNLIFLMTVGFVPVATNALGIYPDLPVVAAFYALSLALVGVAEGIMWLYVNARAFTTDPAEAAHMRLYMGLRIFTPPVVFLLSLALIPVSATAIELSWILMLPLLYLWRFVFPREHAARARYGMGER